MNYYKFGRKQSVEGKLNSSNLYFKGDELIFDREVLLNISHGSVNYVIKIDEGTAVEVNPEDEYIIYFSIDPITATLSTHTTSVVNSYSRFLSHEVPTSPEIDQIYFDLNDMMLKQWNGEYWEEVIGVALGVFNNKSIVDLFIGMSHANITGDYIISSPIVYNNNSMPVRVLTDRGFEFLTKFENEKLNLTNFVNINLEHTVVKSKASTNISENDILVRNDNYTIKPASAYLEKNAIGISLSACKEGDECMILERGFMTSNLWRWESEPHTPLFFDASGKLTTESPLPNDDPHNKIAQRVGYIIDPNTIFFNPENMFIL